MKDQKSNRRALSRRQLFPLLGGSLILPFLGFGKTVDQVESGNEEEYETLLKPDGTTVKVKVSAIKRSKVVKQNLSNKSLLNWLGKSGKHE